MYIPKETIDQIRERVNIEDIILRYVPTLKRKGKNFSGLCPFHKETLPSFTVSPDKQIFYCFGCHAGGNIFSFISKIERLDYPESIRHVAGIVGIEIEESRAAGESRSERDLVYEMLKISSENYHRNLLSGGNLSPLQYLKKRGITDESINGFALGFAPDDWTFLTDTLKKHSFDLSAAERFGLLGISEKSGGIRYYDKFRNRVMFPIMDVQGRVIAFGGRVTDNSLPKYINSAETDFFRKREILYSLNSAKEHIKEMNRVIIVEGYLDVIGCHQFGIKNCVAPLGTALTETQLKTLARYSSEAVLLFDADSAGLRAALRTLEISQDVNLTIKVAVLPEDDPFDFLIKRGARELLAVIDSAVDPADFKIDQALKHINSQGRMKTLMELFEIIKGLKFETERSRYLQKISGIINIDENSLRADFYNYYLKNRTKEISLRDSKSGENLSFLDTCYRDIVAIICSYPSILDTVVIDLAAELEDVRNPVYRNIISKIIEINKSGETFSPDKLFDFFNAGIEMDILNDVINKTIEIDNPVGAFTESYINLKKKKLDNLIRKYSEYLIENNSDRLNDYILEIDSLTREKVKLNDYVYNKTIGI